MIGQPVNHITLENYGFVRLSPNVTLFGVDEKHSRWWDGRLSKVHFSISHHPGHEEINFHLTRNFKDQDNKPKIVIFKIAGTDVDAMAFILAENMIVRFLKPLKVFYDRPPQNKEREKNARFFPFDAVNEHNDENSLYQSYHDAFTKASYIKKKRNLRVKPSVRREFKDMAKTHDFRNDFCKSLRPARQRFKKHPQAGILISGNDSVPVIVIGQKFYTFQTDVTPLEFLRGILGEQLTKRLLLKTLFAIARVGQSETYSDTAIYNQPLTLTLI